MCRTSVKIKEVAYCKWTLIYKPVSKFLKVPYFIKLLFPHQNFAVILVQNVYNDYFYKC